MGENAGATSPEPETPAAAERGSEAGRIVEELRAELRANLQPLAEEQRLQRQMIEAMVQGQETLRQSFEEHEHEVMQVASEEEPEEPALAEKSEPPETAAKAPESVPAPPAPVAPAAPSVKKRVGPFRHARHFN